MIPNQERANQISTHNKSIVTLHFVIGVILIFVGLQARGLWSHSADSSEIGQHKAALALSLLGYIVTIVGFGMKWRRCVQSLRESPIVITLVLVTVLSTAWSILPGITLRRSLGLAIGAIAGTYFGASLTLKQQVQVIRVVALIVTVASLVSIPLTRSSFHLVNHYVAFRGVFTHKNLLARFLSLAVVVTVVGPVKNKSFLLLKLLILAVLAGLMYLAHSATAMTVSLILVALVWMVVPLLRSKGKPFIAGVLLLVSFVLAGTSVIAMDKTLASNVLGRDTTLTGRTELWDAVWAQVMHRPILGYGFGSFWQTQSPYVRQVQSQVHWLAPHAHNGYLDLALDVGLVGLGVFVLLLLRQMIHSVQYIRSSRDPYAAWPLAYLGFTILYNLTESTTVRFGVFYWILFVAICTMRARQASTAPMTLEIQGLEPGQQVSIVTA